MSTIKLRRSSVAGRIPTTAQLELGELAINTQDGKIYFKRYDAVANTESIIDISSNLDASSVLAQLLTVDGANTGLDADLLDGEEGTYYLDFGNFTNLPDPVLTVTGDVEGNTTFTDLGDANLTLELTDTGVASGSYGSASLIPTFTVDDDGRITSANTVAVAGVSTTTWATANNTFTIGTADGSFYHTIIEDFGDITTGDIGAEDITANNIVATTLNGRDITADGDKLDSLEDGIDLSLIGKVTGSGSSNTGILTITTSLEDTGVAANTYGSSTAIPVFTVDDDGRLTAASEVSVAGVDDFTYTSANNTITLETGDGTVFNVRTETEVTLTGKVTGTATATDGNLSIATELANTGVTANTYGSSTAIPILTVDEDGRITLASEASVSGVDDLGWTVANNTLTLSTGNGTDYNVVIDEFTDLTANTVNGRDITADGNKLDTIEEGATADQSNTEIFNAVLSLDGAGTGLDADLLDGSHKSDILAEAASNAAAAIGNGRVTVSGGDGIDVSAFFDLNDFSNTLITIDHSDTSSVANSDNADGTVLQDIAFDTFGHVQSVGTTDLDGRYYTETELDAGQLDNRYYTETELDAGQLDNRYYTETELDAGQLDNRYYTETEADANFVDVTGDTMSGDLTVNADIIQSESRTKSFKVTTTSTAQFALLAFAAADFGATEVLINTKQSSQRHMTKLLITHDGVTAVATEYGAVFTNAELATYDVAISGGNLELRATPASASSTAFNVVATLLDD